MDKAWKIIKGIFWVAITFAAMFIIFTSLNIFDYQMYVVKSGSMEPSIHTGSVVVSNKTNNYKEGDIITFKVSGSKDTVTHRIITIKEENGQTSFQVKGDTNDTPDPDLVLKANVVGEVRLSIPFLGYLIAFIRTLPGLIIFIIIPALIIIAEEMGNIKTELTKIRKAKKKVTKKIKKIEKEIVSEEKEIVNKLTKRKPATIVTEKKPIKSGSRPKAPRKDMKNEK